MNISDAAIVGISTDIPIIFLLIISHISKPHNIIIAYVTAPSVNAGIRPKQMGLKATAYLNTPSILLANMQYSAGKKRTMAIVYSGMQIKDVPDISNTPAESQGAGILFPVNAGGIFLIVNCKRQQSYHACPFNLNSKVSLMTGACTGNSSWQYLSPVCDIILKNLAVLIVYLKFFIFAEPAALLLEECPGFVWRSRLFGFSWPFHVYTSSSELDVNGSDSSVALSFSSTASWLSSASAAGAGATTAFSRSSLFT